MSVLIRAMPCDAAALQPVNARLLCNDPGIFPEWWRAGEPCHVNRAREFVLQHGWNATAYQILDPGIAHWFSAAGDAVIGYVRRSGVRVVAGAPVCAPGRLRDAGINIRAAQSQHARAVFGQAARSGTDRSIDGQVASSELVNDEFHPAGPSDTILNREIIRPGHEQAE